jgi:Ser/Thr protein kinase RdoA (MazF antagonist)
MSADTPARRIAARRGVPELAAHLGEAYGTEVTEIAQLDLGVYRVDRADGPSWVARLFPDVRPRALVDGDAEVLRWLAEVDYPAERLAAPEPVSVLDGQPLLVTDYVPPVPLYERRTAVAAAGGLRVLGWLLGRLHTLEGAPTRPGGAWHHLADGEPRAEVDALRDLVTEAASTVPARGRRHYDVVWEAVEELDAGDGLPTAFTHPDFVIANVVVPGNGTMVLVDWSGAGRGPRMWSLGFLLWAVGFGGDLARVDRTVDGYRRHLTPEPEELARLETLIAARPIVFEAWGFATGRKPLSEAAGGLTAIRERAAAIAARARAAFATS